MSTRKPSYKLVIVESPAKARTISKFLGRSYKVEASQGHVRDLPKSQLGVDVEHDFEPKYITIRGRGEVLERIRKEAKGARSPSFSQRTLTAREKPSRGIWRPFWASIRKSACRVEFNEITEKTVKNAIKEPRAVNMQLVNAQQARRLLDRLVGYKISPLLWVKIKKGLSAGRVQSVATRMVVDREQEIEQFEPEEYWYVDAQLRAGGKQLQRAAHLAGRRSDVIHLRRGAGERSEGTRGKGRLCHPQRQARRTPQAPRRAVYDLQFAAGGEPQARLHDGKDDAGRAAALRRRRH